MTPRRVTEAYERRLWEELNALLADAVPEDASPEDAERAVLLALTGQDPEIKDLYEKVKRLARTECGYLRERMGEDNPVSAVRQRLKLRWSPAASVKGVVVADWSSAASFRPAPVSHGEQLVAVESRGEMREP